LKEVDEAEDSSAGAAPVAGMPEASGAALAVEPSLLTTGDEEGMDRDTAWFR
jgi:hypothetical protein